MKENLQHVRMMIISNNNNHNNNSNNNLTRTVITKPHITLVNNQLIRYSINNKILEKKELY